MDLNFNPHNVFVANEMEEEFSQLPSMPGSNLKHPYKNTSLIKAGDPLYTFKPEHLKLFARVISEFVRRVDQQIMQHDNNQIRSLKVDFILGFKHQHIIEKWIRFAISKGAELIHLFFSHEPYGIPKGYLDLCFFSPSLFSGVKHLHLANCYILPYCKFSGFHDHLKILVLSDLAVHRVNLLNLIPTCSHLEDLTFIGCQFNFAVNITIPTLLHLKLIACHLPLKIDIVTPKLSSFEYRGDILSLSSISAPHLAKFCLTPYSPRCHSEDLGELQTPPAFALLANLHQLQSLFFFFSLSQVATLPTTIPPFQHLREMQLFFHGEQDDDNYDYLWVLDMVMACPRLQKLYFGIAAPYLSANQRQRREHPGFSHSELKYVELHGCVGHTTEIELAIHFLRNVSSLEVITFGPNAKIYLGDGEWMDGFDSPHWFSAGRNLIQEELQDCVDDARTQLIFL